MLLAGIIIAGVGAVTIGTAIALELKTKESKYFILMKIASGLFGVGGILAAIGGLS